MFDFFRRLFGGKTEEEKRREQQQAAQRQQAQQRPTQVQQPRPTLPSQQGMSGLGLSGQRQQQPWQQKPNSQLTPLQQANTANQQVQLQKTPTQQTLQVQKPQVQQTQKPAAQPVKPVVQAQQPKPAGFQRNYVETNEAALQRARKMAAAGDSAAADYVRKNTPQRPKLPQPTTNNNIFNPNPTMSIIKNAEQQEAQRLSKQKQQQDYLDSRMRERGVPEPEIAKSRQERIKLDNQAYLAGQEANRSANLARTVGMATAPARSVVSFSKGAVDGAGRMVGNVGDNISLFMADSMQGLTGDEKYQRTRERILADNQRRNQQYDEQFGVFKANDSDVKFAHELGQGASRLAADAGMAVVTGGTVPAAIHGAEHAANYVTEANSHGVKTRDALPLAYGSAAVNAAIERIGINKLLSPGGKTALGNVIRGAVSEGAEEGAQTISENAFAKAYDPNRKLTDNVFKNTASGVLLGGPAGAANVGGMRSNNNVNTTTNSAPQPVTSVVDAVAPAASPALKQSVSNNIDNIQKGDTAAIARQHGNMGRLESYLVRNATEAVMSNPDTQVRYKTDNSLTPAQDGFFKDSKIRDEDGSLKPMYHGTNVKFDQFDKDNIRTDNFGRGFYFTDNREIADSYASRRAKERGGDENTIETYLEVKRPFDLNYQSRDVAADYLDFYFSKNGMGAQDAMVASDRLLNDSLANGDIVNDDYSIMFDTSEPEFQEWARNRGYDGLIIPGKDKSSGKNGDAVVVFEPNQIKYTDNLNPTNDPDMRYKMENDSGRVDDFVRFMPNDDAKKLLADNYQAIQNEITDAIKMADTSGQLDDIVYNSQLIKDLRESMYDLDAEDQFIDTINDYKYERLDELGYEIEPSNGGDNYDDLRIIEKGTGRTDDEVNKMIAGAIYDLGFDFEKSRSWAAGSIPSRYIKLFDEQVRVANHENSYGNQYEAIYNNNDLRDSTITPLQIQSDILEQTIRLIEGADIDGHIDMYSEGDTIHDALEAISEGSDRNISYNTTEQTLRFLDKTINAQEIDQDDVATSVKEWLIKTAIDKKASLDSEIRYKLKERRVPGSRLTD